MNKDTSIFLEDKPKVDDVLVVPLEDLPKSNKGRPRKYNYSNNSTPFTKQSKTKVSNPSSNVEALPNLSSEFVLEKLRANAELGDTRAMELLGKELGMFTKSDIKTDRDAILDLFLEENTVEEAIFNLLDTLEDKYEDINLSFVE